MALDGKAIQKEFAERLRSMLDLLARGRGIEILLRIADQTQEGLRAVSDSYEQMLRSDLKVPNLHPPQSLPKLFSDPLERARLELARDIADKLAHGLYRAARKLVDRYEERYGLKAILNDNRLPGWELQAAGHIVEEDGKRIDSIVDLLKSTNKNLIVEEYDVFVHNNYDEAAHEIFDDAWRRILAAEKSLAIESAKLHMFRGFRRGKKTYIVDDTQE